MAGYCSLFKTAWGVGEVTANEAGLLQVLLPDYSGNKREESTLSTIYHESIESPLTMEAARLLCRYFDGEHIVFDLRLDTSKWTKFSAAVYRVVCGIPYGELRSYGQIAIASGHPGAARAVGRVMASNRLPIVIPCHRVVAASGALTGYSAPGGLPVKAKLLRLEGAEY
jgi:methylated-DNA-[protein]-cysteine S-methyltransferase